MDYLVTWSAITLNDELGTRPSCGILKPHTTIRGLQNSLKNRCLELWTKERDALGITPLEIEQWLKYFQARKATTTKTSTLEAKQGGN